MHTPLILAFLAACAPETGTLQIFADAGPNLIGSTQDAYVFDGSDTEGAELFYAWRLGQVPDGSALGPDDLVDADSAAPVLIPDVAGQYEVILEACDVFGQCSESDTWAWATENGETRVAAPMANAGSNVNISLGTTASLVDAGSSGLGLSYVWSVTNKPGESILRNSDILRRTTASASALPDWEGTFTFRLRVTDSNGAFSSDFVNYVVGPGNAPPRAFAVAGASAAFVGDAIDLDGASSYDPSGEAITYRWSFYTKPGGSALSNSSISGRYTSNATFVPDVPGNYRLKLTVSDSMNTDISYTTTIVVSFADDDWPS